MTTQSEFRQKLNRGDGFIRREEEARKTRPQPGRKIAAIPRCPGARRAQSLSVSMPPFDIPRCQAILVERPSLLLPILVRMFSSLDSGDLSELLGSKACGYQSRNKSRRGMNTSGSRPQAKTLNPLYYRDIKSGFRNSQVLEIPSSFF